MNAISEPPRPWFGLMFLVLATGMLLWGLTVLESRLAGKTFIVYWTLCFLFAGLALILSLIEARKMRERYRRQERELMEKTLRDIVQGRENKQE